MYKNAMSMEDTVFTMNVADDGIMSGSASADFGSTIPWERSNVKKSLENNFTLVFSSSDPSDLICKWVSESHFLVTHFLGIFVLVGVLSIFLSRSFGWMRSGMGGTSGKSLSVNMFMYNNSMAMKETIFTMDVDTDD